MKQVLVTTVLATTDLVDKYGGRALTPNKLFAMADGLRQPGGVFTIDHDSRRKIRPDIQKVWIEHSDRGAFELHAQFTLSEEDWQVCGGHVGFSYEEVETAYVVKPDGRPLVGVYAEASQFDDDAIRGAIKQLDEALKDYTVAGGPLYQFAEEVPAKVALEFLLFALQQIGPGVLSSALYDVIKSWFLKPKHASETVFRFRVISGTHALSMHLTTSDSEVVKAAVSQLREVALSYPQQDDIVFDPERRKWMLPNGAEARMRVSRTRTTEHAVRPANQQASRRKRPRKRR